MNDIQILLSDDINNEDKYKAANDIIANNELSLCVNQILSAFNNILDWTNNCVYKKIHEKNFSLLLKKVLTINKNMFIAIILALCDNLNPARLTHFIVYDNANFSDVGLNIDWYSSIQTIFSYHNLLNYCDFDVYNIQTIPDNHKQKIQEYRDVKYSGKLTKCAIKK